jgi:DNA-binding MarR family transcriptional regulator
MPSARDCARLLLEAVPGTMRVLGGIMRQRRAADEEPLSMGQLHMLEILRERPVSLSDLAARHRVAPSTMSRTVDVLVKRAWVSRRSDPADRRQVILSLTPEGESAQGAMRMQTQDALTSLVELLDDRERERLYDGLQVLHDLAMRAAAHGHHCGPEEREPATDQRLPTKDD